MEFYLNHKSLPMIRRCGNCHYFHKAFQSCSKIVVTNAYDHKKSIFLGVGENLYCEKHRFHNEDTLKEDAILVEYDDIKEALDVIKKSRDLKVIKKTMFGGEDD